MLDWKLSLEVCVEEELARLLELWNRHALGCKREELKVGTGSL